MNKENIVHITVKRIGNIIGALIPIVWFLLDEDWNYATGSFKRIDMPVIGSVQIYEGDMAVIFFSIIAWFVGGWIANYLAHTKFVITVDSKEKETEMDKKENRKVDKNRNLASIINNKDAPVELRATNKTAQSKRIESVQKGSDKDDAQTSNSMNNKEDNDAITTGQLIVRIILAFTLYVIAAYFLMPTPWVDSLSETENAIRQGTERFIFFMVPFAFASLIIVIVAKVLPSTRHEPLAPFLNYALIFATVLSIIMLYFGWYGRNQINM